MGDGRHTVAPLRLPCQKLGPPYRKAVGLFLRERNREGSAMRISVAGLLFVITVILVACVHESTVFHSPNGLNYFREGPVGMEQAPGGAPAISPTPANRQD